VPTIGILYADSAYFRKYSPPTEFLSPDSLRDAEQHEDAIASESVRIAMLPVR
jgi:hypothetical protein